MLAQMPIVPAARDAPHPNSVAPQRPAGLCAQIVNTANGAVPLLCKDTACAVHVLLWEIGFRTCGTAAAVDDRALKLTGEARSFTAKQRKCYPWCQLFCR